MGLFDWFPYTNLQELNLSWVLQTIKKLEDEYNNLQKEIQETIDFVNNFEQHADELIAEQVEAALANYNSRLTMLEKELEALNQKLDDTVLNGINELQTQIDDLQIQINRLSHIINDKILDLEELMHEYKHSIDDIIDGKAEELQKFIFEQVTTLDRLDIINPLNGLLENVQDVINDIYAIVSKSFGITAEQYDSLHLSAKDFDTIFITAGDYDTRGYFMLFMKLTFALVRSPFTGLMDSFQNVLDRLTELHKCGMTAAEYDSLLLTAEGYDKMELTAWAYDWFGYKVARPVTAANYDALGLSASAYDSLLVTAEEYEKGMKALIPTKLARCNSQCGNYFILAGQITNMSAEIDKLKNEVADIDGITARAGVTYIDTCDVGQSTSLLSIPDITADSMVEINCSKPYYPLKIAVLPGQGVETTWLSSITLTEPLTYTVNVLNK